MKKKVIKIIITKDVNGDIDLKVVRVNRNGVIHVLATNFKNEVVEEVENILYESENSFYKLISTPLPKYEKTRI